MTKAFRGLTPRTPRLGWILGNTLYLLVTITLVYGFLHLHFVKTPEGWKVYGKKTWGFQDSCLNLTEISVSQLRDHPEVVETMLRSGDGRLLPGGPVLQELYKLGVDVPHMLSKFDGDLKVAESLKELQSAGSRKLDELKNIAGDAGKDAQKTADRLKNLVGGK